MASAITRSRPAPQLMMSRVPSRAWTVSLERLAQANGPRAATSSTRDPYRRLVDDFAFKRAPLFVEQITSSPGDHRLSYVGVDRFTYCLLTAEARRSVVARVYGPADRTLRVAGVKDLQFVVVPVTRHVATYEQALAIAADKTVRLTRRGRAC